MLSGTVSGATSLSLAQISKAVRDCPKLHLPSLDQNQAAVPNLRMDRKDAAKEMKRWVVDYAWFKRAGASKERKTLRVQAPDERTAMTAAFRALYEIVQQANRRSIAGRGGASGRASTSKRAGRSVTSPSEASPARIRQQPVGKRQSDTAARLVATPPSKAHRAALSDSPTSSSTVSTGRACTSTSTSSHMPAERKDESEQFGHAVTNANDNPTSGAGARKPEKGDDVMRNGQRCRVLAVDTLDPSCPFYTVLLPSGREVNTECVYSNGSQHLRLWKT